MTAFVGERAAAVCIAGSNASHIIVLQNNSICVGSPLRRVVGVACSSSCIRGHVYIHVAVSRPVDELLHLIGAVVGQLTFDAVDSRMAVALGVSFGQAEFDVHVVCDVHKPGYNLPCIWVELPEVPIQDGHCVQNLLGRNVLWAVVMDHVEHHGNDVHLIVVAATLQHSSCGRSGCGLPQFPLDFGFWIKGFQRILGLVLATG